MKRSGLGQPPLATSPVANIPVPFCLHSHPLPDSPDVEFNSTAARGLSVSPGLY